MPAIDSCRWLAALLAVLAYALLCLRAWRQARIRRASAWPAADTAWQVVFASQNGTAEHIARQSAASLIQAGLSVNCLALDQLDPARLGAGGRFLFVVSTAGDGQAPDNGSRFVRDTMPGCPDLKAVDYALLGMGDRQYRQFNAFGRALDAWLQQAGARRHFDCIELDRCDAGGLANWREHLQRLGGAPEITDWNEDAPLSWTLLQRQHLNPGSCGAPIHRLVFAIPAGAPPWQAGDLALLSPPGDPDHPRAYSIASLPAEGSLQLLVRRQHRPDGSPGTASHWLGETLEIGDSATIRLRPHAAFRLAGNATRPLILIGAGVGLAGLRAHLAARHWLGEHRNWLIFGERSAQHDDLLRDELTQWQGSGHLPHCDKAFSRDPEGPRYVQEILRCSAGRLREWLALGAAIHVCGSRRGLGAGVEQALVELLGAEQLAELSAAGRYRRDLF